MGTTIASLTIAGDEALVVNVGDSRVYHLEEHRLVQLTINDALSRTALTQSLGSERVLAPDRPLATLTPSNRQRILLATGGLFDHLHTDALEASLTESDHDTVGQWLDVALATGWRDNISVSLVRTSTRQCA